MTRFQDAVRKRRRRGHLLISAETDTEVGRESVRRESVSPTVLSVEESSLAASEETQTRYVPSCLLQVGKVMPAVRCAALLITGVLSLKPLRDPVRSVN